jgi:glycerophosphoryl diester phosphodiesterase
MTKVLLSAHKCGQTELGEQTIIENALKACELGADFVEFDVRITKDKKFVIWHDRSISIGGKLVPISRVSCAVFLANEPQSCTLNNLLIAIRGKTKGHVDLKDRHKELEIVDLCISKLGRDGFVVTTLHDKSVRKLRKFRPDCMVGLTLGADTRGLPKKLAFKIRMSEYFPEMRITRTKPNFLAIYYKETIFGSLYLAKFDKLPVLLWTIDNPNEIKHAFSSPLIWMFTTNYPKQAIHIRQQAIS